MPVSRTELKKLRALLTKRGRREAGRFSVDGVRVLEEAWHHGARPRAVYWSPSLVSERGRTLVERFAEGGVAVHELSARDFRSVADTQTPQGVLGVFDTPPTELGRRFHKRCRAILWCDRIADPTNLGLLVRSAAAFGMDLVVAGGESAEVFAPKTVRASAGAVFAVPVAVAPREELFNLVSRHGFHLIAADSRGRATTSAMADIAGPVVLALGSEADGLPPEIVQQAELVVRIDHRDTVESLNVAVAGAILMRELYALRGARRA